MVKDIKELNNELCELFETLKKDPKRIAHAKELNNSAGKILKLQAIRCEYAKLRGVQPDIAFLNCEA